MGRRRRRELKGLGLTRSRCALTFASKSEPCAQKLLMETLPGSTAAGVGQDAVTRGGTLQKLLFAAQCGAAGGTRQTGIELVRLQVCQTAACLKC